MKYYHPYELEQANNMLLKLIKEQMLKGNLALTDINQELRIMFPNIYITAFRISRESSKLYAKDMHLLITDIIIADTNRKDLIEIYVNNYLEITNKYPDSKDLKFFKLFLSQLTDEDEQLKLKLAFEKNIN
ncbi:hypothetical protein [Ruminococcus sp.]|uniref:hypothetical protein n=1 Tax=Ruminococcus sp. TaxID=41978 RepID=UPI002E81AC77|nr:hypothetical protein [Ruminococcus sp.]MEE3439307.1 hypothetical protein [Ruminococcus sp.]